MRKASRKRSLGTLTNKKRARRANERRHRRLRLETLEARQMLFAGLLSDDMQLLADFNAQPNNDRQPSHLTAVGSSIYFMHDDGLHGREWWRTDGTETGTTLVADILPGPLGQSNKVQRPAVLGDQLVFIASTGSLATGEDTELWIAGGSVEGAQRIKDIWPGEFGSEPLHLTEHGGFVYFTAVTDEYGPSI